MRQSLNPPVAARNAAKLVITPLCQTGSGTQKKYSSFRGHALRARPEIRQSGARLDAGFAQRALAE
jgi:hypothetical protein